MPKDVEIVEGGSLMDPAGKPFQDMLASAQMAAVEKLTVTPDTSMVEEKDEKKDEQKEASSATDTRDKEETDVDVPGDDIGNLKHQVSGLKAELARIRNQRTGSSEEVVTLKERLANAEGQLKVLNKTGTTDVLAEKLAQLTDDQVADNRISWEDELADARAVIRQAERDGDQPLVKEMNQRIVNARSMLKAYDTEKSRRITVQSTKSTSEADEQKGLVSDTEKLFAEAYAAVPELKDKDSAIWKAGQKEYSALPHLMKKLGPLGELIATAQAIAKNPHLIGKKVISDATGKVLDNIEKAADKAFHKGGTAPSGAVTLKTSVNSREDLSAFEEQVRRVKSG